MGSLSFAFLISKLMQLPDPTSYGSKNAGATNVLRTGNRKAAYLVLCGDVLKGVLVVFCAKKFGEAYSLGDSFTCVAAISVFLGHIFPIYFRFKGGKGVATSAGVIWILDLRLGICALLVWIFIAFLTRYSSLAAITASFATCVISYVIFGYETITITIWVIFILILVGHKKNIGNLISGRESRIKLKI